jgi:hypothetical protein
MKEKEQSSPLSFKQLPVGFEFPPTSYELTEAVIGKYLEAVGEETDFLTSGIVPPLAIAACAMTALSQSFTVPPDLVILEINVLNQAGEKVLTGRATIAAPN